MKYRVSQTAQFRKDYKRISKRHYDVSLLHEVVAKLANGETLSAKHKDHALTGEFKCFREFHITPDWLLVYRKFENNLILSLLRTGTHSDLF